MWSVLTTNKRTHTHTHKNTRKMLGVMYIFSASVWWWYHGCMHIYVQTHQNAYTVLNFLYIIYTSVKLNKIIRNTWNAPPPKKKSHPLNPPQSCTHLWCQYMAGLRWAECLDSISFSTWKLLLQVKILMLFTKRKILIFRMVLTEYPCTGISYRKR